MFKTMLICTDGSECSLRAAQKGVTLAKEQDACVLLLHVEASGLPVYTVPWQLEIGSIATLPRMTKQQHSNLDRIQALCQTAGLRYRCRHESGHAAEQILRVAEEESVDLIVVGSRGLSEWKSLVLGSVSDHVVHHAECSVLVVR